MAMRRNILDTESLMKYDYGDGGRPDYVSTPAIPSWEQELQIMEEFKP